MMSLIHSLILHSFLFAIFIVSHASLLGFTAYDAGIRGRPSTSHQLNWYSSSVRWPSYYAYYRSPLYGSTYYYSYPLNSTYYYSYPSYYTNYIYPSYPYNGNYYINNYPIPASRFYPRSSYKRYSYHQTFSPAPVQTYQVTRSSGVFFGE